jgi:hypothetical protein
MRYHIAWSDYLEVRQQDVADLLSREVGILCKWVDEGTIAPTTDGNKYALTCLCDFED